MLFASITTERDWPWRDGDLLGWPGLLGAALVLVLLTLWTYSGQRAIGWRKVFVVLGLRLGALAAIILLLLRPSFASEQEVVTPGRLIILVDSSLSMKISDAPNSSTRWDFARKLLELADIKDALARLQKAKQIDIVFYQGAENIRKYDPAGDAVGKRTDIGKWLNAIWTAHRNDRNLRGLVLLTDGADNGTSYAVLDEAAKLRELPCLIHTFGVGSPVTRTGQRDIAVVDVKATREPIYVKNPVLIKTVIDAPNLEGQMVTLRLFIDDKEVSKQSVNLPNSRGNIIDAGTFVPDKVGEVKVTVKVDEVPGEFDKLNNEMTTYVNVRKEGLNILWVEGPMRLEATWALRWGLGKNQRFSITYLERLTNSPPTPEQAAYFTTPDKSFDVVIVGDISAERFAAGDNAIFSRIAQSVNAKRTGLLMLGGYNTFGKTDWQSTGKDLTALLPVDLIDSGIVDGEAHAQPVVANKDHRLLQLDVPANKDLWREVFGPLGLARLGKLRPGAVPLLTADGNDMFVVSGADGPRTAVFGGNTTCTAWYGNDDAVRAYERFWTTLVTWLARQDEGESQVWIKLDKRRIAVGANLTLGFTVGADGKDGKPLTNARYVVKVHGPGGEVFDVNTATKASEERGAFGQANAVGEYKVTVTATAPGADGQQIPLGTTSARFMGYAEDVENQQPAANHQDLIKLAVAGGGAFHIAGKEELLQYLNEMRNSAAGPGWIKRDVWPNWKMPPASDALSDQLGALMESLALPLLVAFVICLGMEWFLRRKWGLV